MLCFEDMRLDICFVVGHIWIEGDGAGRDSGSFGAVPMALLKGRVCGAG
jgi:hypothetical protein